VTPKDPNVNMYYSTLGYPVMNFYLNFVVYFYNFPIISILQNVFIMSMPIYWYFSVLFAKKVSQSFSSLVAMVAAAESAIGLTISFCCRSIT
jgi:NADH:ubiquinone oxidoreductase subunit K